MSKLAQLSSEQLDKLLKNLKKRFGENMHRHPTLKWEQVEEKIHSQPDKLPALLAMEETGGEPDVIGDEFIFIDCSIESPKGRRSYCYDREALDNRKKNQPENDVLTVASDIGIELLTEEEYRKLQSIEPFDLKTSSWVRTPSEIRKLNGALFCDRRYNNVFVYHNGADSYYSSRGFRGKLVL